MNTVLKRIFLGIIWIYSWTSFYFTYLVKTAAAQIRKKTLIDTKIQWIVV